MKLCLIGKYPPIEGGVSANTYWIAHALAERGHEVHVVTNAGEVEDTYRMQIGPEDAEHYAHVSPSGGRVEVHQPEPFGRRSAHHIPRSTPFVSRLAGLATDVIRRHGCEMIFAYYYEPYGMAGALAAQWTEVPLVLRHAGSDLDRLGLIPDLARSYKEILRRADGVMTRPPLYGRFIGMGVDPQRLLPTPAYSVPTDVFAPEASPLDWQKIGRPMGPPEAMADDAPVIGIYGKIGETKGTYDLIAALGALRQQGRDFTLLALIGDVQARILAPEIEAAGLSGRTWALPFLPHWRVPSFLTACTAVAFLERDFPVVIHGPVVPREILAAGRCLILSGEISEKNAARLDLRHGENVILVPDPKDRVDLAEKLESVLADPARAEEIGRAGRALSLEAEHFETFGEDWETALSSVLGPQAQPSATAPRATLEALIPELLDYAEASAPDLVAAFLSTARAIQPYDLAHAFCDQLRARLLPSCDAALRARLESVLDWTEASLELGHERPSEAEPVFPAADALQGAALAQADLSALAPVRGSFVRLLSLAHDVSPLRGQLSWQDGEDDHIAALEEKPAVLLLARTANLAVREYLVNASVAQLLNLCDGTRTVAQIVASMTPGAPAPATEQAILEALGDLYRREVLVFARPGGLSTAPLDPPASGTRPRRAARAP